jgi:hypothetical protein
MSEAGKFFLRFVRGLNVFGRGKITIPNSKRGARPRSVFRVQSSGKITALANLDRGNFDWRIMKC